MNPRLFRPEEYRDAAIAKIGHGANLAPYRLIWPTIGADLVLGSVREPIGVYPNLRIISTLKRIRFVGSARQDLGSLPRAARARAGFELFAVQAGRDPTDWKPMSSVGPGACELRVRDAAGAYRVIYVARFHDAVYVLQAFQKKSRKTARTDLDIARDRYRVARGLSEGAIRGKDRE